MEHRWNQRNPLASRVVLHRKYQPTLICRLRDVSLGGMLVDCGSQCFAKYESVAIELSLRLGGELKRFRVAAMVVHSGRDGIGVMFKQIDVKCGVALAQYIDQLHRHDKGFEGEQTDQSSLRPGA